jgi:hypothetical protein
MANGFGGVPVEAKVAAGNGKVGGDGQFFSGTGGEQGAVVADAQPKAALGSACGAAANLEQNGEFALPGSGSGIGLFTAH